MRPTNTEESLLPTRQTIPVFKISVRQRQIIVIIIIITIIIIISIIIIIIIMHYHCYFVKRTSLNDLPHQLPFYRLGIPNYYIGLAENISACLNKSWVLEAA